MSESEIEEYIIDTKEGKSHFTLRVSLYDERVKLLITTTERPNKKYYNLVRLSQLKEACNAFEKTSSIKDALIILKTNIESGNIMISEENIDVIDVKFVLKIKGKTYSPFVIGLPIDDDKNDNENNELQEKKDLNDDNKNNNNIKETNKDQNKDIEVLPTEFDYQGNKEAQLKYGQSTKSTTEYVNPIIKSDVKEPNLILEYIEPILQVHYPDGTTKSTALPARLQTADGKEPNMAPEQLKSIHEQIYKNFSQNVIELENEKSRANSVSRRNYSTDFSRQTFNVQNSLTNLNNALNNLTPNLKTFQSNEINSNSNSNDINAVRSALKPNINMNINMNMSTLNNYNIRQVKTQFNPYDNLEERNTTGKFNNSINSINLNMPLTPRDNYTNFRQNKLINKGLSDYSISSVPNKPLVSNNLQNMNPNYNYNTMISNNTPNKSTIVNNNSPLIQEVPKFLDKNQNNNAFNKYNNIIMLQKGLNKSSSSPSMQTLGKVNHNFYQNQGQTGYYYRQNNFNNFNNFPNQGQNLQNQINNVNLQMNNNISNNTNKINNTNTYTPFMNYTYNSHLPKNNQNFNFNNIPNNALSRNYSNQNTSTAYRTMNPLMQSSDDIRYQQLMNQRRLQEQQRLQLLQRAKMSNMNYNNLSNINNSNINANTNINYNNVNYTNLNNVSRNPNMTQNSQISMNSRNSQNNNYAEVNFLNQQIRTKTQVRNTQDQNTQNTQNMQPMNNLRNRNNLSNINPNQNIPNMNPNPSILKQSHSQQVIRQTPSLKNEITQQQIALAELASLQNQQNPNNYNANLVALNQRFLDSSGNEETQSQFERESNKEPQIRDNNLKIENENSNKKIEKQSENIIQTPKKISQEKAQIPVSNSTSQTKIPETTPQEEDDDEEDPEAEKLFRLENGLIIFRNGLLRGIIHKYKEIDDVVSKIQLKLMAGVKFMLLYRASTDGDKAKIFHEKCDKHGMTLVLVETTKGVRFGGFTTKTWDGNCIKKIDNDAFVFSFDKRKCYDVIRNEYAIGGYPKFGPVFFGCQIRIYDNFFTKGGTTCNRGLNYKTKQDYELNNGEQRYIVKEIEVYDIESIEV